MKYLQCLSVLCVCLTVSVSSRSSVAFCHSAAPPSLLTAEGWSLFSSFHTQQCVDPHGSLTFSPPTTSASCQASSVVSVSSIPMEHNPWPLTCDTVDPQDSPNILSRGPCPLENCPTMPQQGVPGSHFHCFGEAEMMIWATWTYWHSHCQNCTTYLSTYSSIGVFLIKIKLIKSSFCVTHSGYCVCQHKHLCVSQTVLHHTSMLTLMCIS